LTPMMLPTVRGTPSTENLALAVACRACKTLLQFAVTICIYQTQNFLPGQGPKQLGRERSSEQTARFFRSHLS
jgi:hypothetical protein